MPSRVNRQAQPDTGAGSAWAAGTAKPDKDWIKLRRSGRRPLVFRGQRLVECTTRKLGGPIWHDIGVYELYSGGFVLAVSCYARTASVKDRHTVMLLSTVEEVQEALIAYDPTRDVPVDPADWIAGETVEALCQGAARLKAELAQAQKHFKIAVGSMLPGGNSSGHPGATAH